MEILQALSGTGMALSGAFFGPKGDMDNLSPYVSVMCTSTIPCVRNTLITEGPLSPHPSRDSESSD